MAVTCPGARRLIATGCGPPRPRVAPEIRDPLTQTLNLAVLPRDEQLAGVEDRGVGAADNADQQGQHEIPASISPPKR